MSHPLDRRDVTALSDRMGYLLGLRIAFAGIVLTWAALRPEEGAEWERGGLYKPCLVEEKGVFYLFYNAKVAARPAKEQTGVAISRDLRAWTRHEANPLIRNGSSVVTVHVPASGSIQVAEEESGCGEFSNRSRSHRHASKPT